MFKTYSIDTPFGVVEVSPTDGRHVHVSAGSSGRNRLTYRDDTYYLSLHLGLYDGTWQPWRDERGEVSRTYMSLDRGGYPAKPTAKTYRAKIEAGVIEAVQAFLAAHQDVLFVAQDDDLERKYESLSAEVTELVAKLAEKRKELSAAAKALGEHRDSLLRK